MRNAAHTIPAIPAVAIRRATSAVTCRQASTEVMRIVQVRLAAITVTTRVRRSFVGSQQARAQPGVTHNVTSPTNTVAVVPFAHNAVTVPITALTRPTEAVTSRSP